MGRLSLMAFVLASAFLLTRCAAYDSGYGYYMTIGYRY